VDEAGEQLRCGVDGGVDAEGGAFVRRPRKEVDKRVSCVIPELWYLSRCQHTRYHTPWTICAYLFAVQQESQTVRHLVLMSDDPRERTVVPLWSSRGGVISHRCASKQTALSPQLLQLPPGRCIYGQGRRSRSAVEGGRCARRSVQGWRWLEGLKGLQFGSRLDGLDGGVRERDLESLVQAAEDIPGQGVSRRLCVGALWSVESSIPTVSD
jgi:hypothetical protein